jgi:uncharacterized membrane protein
MMAHVLATLALVGIASLLGATIYEAVVMAPNYERDIPTSIDLARRFLRRTTPAHYFRILTPVTQVVLLAGVVASWRLAPARWGLATALGILVLTDVITFTFHYPRLAVLFKAPMPDDPERLRRAAREWSVGNYVRAALLAVALLATLHAIITGPIGHVP